PPVQFNTGSFPPAPVQYGTGSTPPVPYGGGSTPPAQYRTGSLPPAPFGADQPPAPPQPQPPPFAPAPGYRLDGPGRTLPGGAARPQPAGTTEAGLPRRDPGAQLVPGSARAVDAPPSPPRYGPGGDHEQAARTARTLLAAYRDGVERGRSVRDATDPGYPR